MSTPLFQKLGLKEGMSVRLINPPDNYIALTGLSTNQKPKTTIWDFIHLFTNSVAELETTLPGLKPVLNKQGMIWVSWYKKSSGKSSELSDVIVRDCALAIGLVDVKVCAVDADWSGLKLVFRLRDR
jgi:hypothetical protein